MVTAEYWTHLFPKCCLLQIHPWPTPTTWPIFWII